MFIPKKLNFIFFLAQLITEFRTKQAEMQGNRFRLGLVVPLPSSVDMDKEIVTQSLTGRETLSVVKTTAETSGLG